MALADNTVYWITELLGLILGCWVVFEIYRVALAAYPGTARMARNVLGFLFAMALARAVAALWGDARWPADTVMLHMERALRIFQALSTAALVALFVFYSIPFGRNLRGILLGYALFIAQRVICLTFVQPTGPGVLVLCLFCLLRSRPDALDIAFMVIPGVS